MSEKFGIQPWEMEDLTPSEVDGYRNRLAQMAKGARA